MIEIINIIQWFNPFIYLYKKSLKTTHEYLSDEKVIEQGFDSDEYKLLLLKQRIGVQPGFANNFNKSLTLKRITMMNQKKSNSIAKLKVLFAIPVIAFSLFLFSFNSSSNITSNKTPDNVQVQDTIPDVRPKYPGGDMALRTFIVNKLKYPKEAVEKGLTDIVYVKFLVTKDGKVTDVEVVKGNYEILNNEAIRVVKMMPDFKPALKDDKPVDAYMTIPINFSLKD